MTTNQMIDGCAILAEFNRRLYSEWLPAFCNDPRRRFSPTGFNSESIKISEFDAANFIKAIDSGLVWDAGGGRYCCARSNVAEQIFWTGEKRLSPRPITLWIEPIVTIGAVARLALDFGWSPERIGMQSATWAFDVVVYRSTHSETEYVAGEVKKSQKELDDLVEHLKAFGRGESDLIGPAAKIKNSRKKFDALLESRSPFFWAVAPNDYTQLFVVKYGANNTAEFHVESNDTLVAKNHDPT